MSDLGDLLELVHTSVRRWRTLRVAGLEWHHRARSLQAWERFFRRDLSRGVASVRGSKDDAQAEEVREPWSLWIAQPDQVRAEFMVEDDTVTAVIDGNTWWSWSPSRGVTTNEGDSRSSHGRGPGDALIDPSSILPGVELDVFGSGTFIGRPVHEVVATPSPIDEDDEESFDRRGSTHGLGGGADEYALLVDAERGVLLRSEARIAGDPFRIIEMQAVAFDEELGEETFAPPPGETVETVALTRDISLMELPGEVSFTVLVPEHPPFGPDDVNVHPPDRRQGMPEQVRIHFASQFFGEEDREFSLVESAEPMPDRPSVVWRDGDDARFGEDTSVDPPVRIVRIERRGTYVEVQSYFLGMEELLDLARSLVPLSEAPPSLRAAAP